MTRPLNLCSACGQDFGSISGFDSHRVGKHAHTTTEGLRMDPPREDGRRCLATWELEEKGWRSDYLGRWRMPARQSPRPVSA
jgi:hypothetical protein